MMKTSGWYWLTEIGIGNVRVEGFGRSWNWGRENNEHQNSKLSNHAWAVLHAIPIRFPSFNESNQIKIFHIHNFSPSKASPILLLHLVQLSLCWPNSNSKNSVQNNLNETPIMMNISCVNNHYATDTERKFIFLYGKYA